MRIKAITLSFLLFTVLFNDICFAYLDPGTGSYVIQVIIALMVGAAVSVKMFWKRIVNFFRKFLTK